MQAREPETYRAVFIITRLGAGLLIGQFRLIARVVAQHENGFTRLNSPKAGVVRQLVQQ